MKYNKISQLGILNGDRVRLIEVQFTVNEGIRGWPLPYTISFSEPSLPLSQRSCFSFRWTVRRALATRWRWKIYGSSPQPFSSILLFCVHDYLCLQTWPQKKRSANRYNLMVTRVKYGVIFRKSIRIHMYWIKKNYTRQSALVNFEVISGLVFITLRPDGARNAHTNAHRRRKKIFQRSGKT